MQGHCVLTKRDVWTQRRRGDPGRRPRKGRTAVGHLQLAERLGTEPPGHLPGAQPSRHLSLNLASRTETRQVSVLRAQRGLLAGAGPGNNACTQAPSRSTRGGAAPAGVRAPTVPSAKSTGCRRGSGSCTPSSRLGFSVNGRKQHFPGHVLEPSWGCRR